MKVSTNWLKQYTNLPDMPAEELAKSITMAVVEVEDVISQKEQLTGIVVGKVMNLVPHPQADRLSVCQVSIGEKTLQIICGGINVKKAMTVAVATVGSRVRWHGEGELITLDAAKIRGVESHGMIASSNEIGLDRLFPANEEREILDLSGLGLRVGTPLAEALGLTDTILDIENKSMNHRPDLWGHYGMARELAALFDTKLKPLKIKRLPDPTSARSLSLSVKSDACMRYRAVVIDGIAVSDSPWWLKRDLESVGAGSHNSIVDITNYVMLAVGQPLHAFDYEKIPDAALVVSEIENSTPFTALNEKQYTLPAGILAIRTKQGQPLALGGIIGGKGSMVTPETKTIVLEAATFDSAHIRKTSNALALRTEASARFEKGLDPALPETALALAVELILKMHPGSFVASAVVEHNATRTAPTTIELSYEFLQQRLGVAMDTKEVVSILKRLHFDVKSSRQTLRVTVPSHRLRDITIPEDIVEEVARFYGYDRIPATLPRVPMRVSERNNTSRLERDLRTILSRGLAYDEVYRYSFADPFWSQKLGFDEHAIGLKNSLTSGETHMRTSLIPQLVACAIENTRWYQTSSLFEIGRVFQKGAGEFTVAPQDTKRLPKQPYWCAGARISKVSSAETLFREAKGTFEYLCSYYGIPATGKEVKRPQFAVWYEYKLHDQVIGHVGLLRESDVAEHARGYNCVVWQLSWELFIKFADSKKTIEPLPRYPSMVRDMAVVVDEATTWGAIYEKIHAISPMLRAVELFDVYMSPKLGAHKKSFAFSLHFEHEDKTLTSAEVDVVIAQIRKILADAFNAQIR